MTSCDALNFNRVAAVEVSLVSFAPTTMFSIADFLLSKISYRLPVHLYTYVRGATPLSTDKSVLAALASYLVIIFSIQGFLKNRKPHQLTTLFQTHNVLLSLGSLLVLALMLEEIVPMLWKHGIHYTLCSESAWTPVSPHSSTHLLILGFNILVAHREWNFTTWLITISSSGNC